MGDTTNSLESSVKLEMGWHIGGRAQPTHGLSIFESDDRNVVGTKLRVRYAARLDRDDPGVAIHTADVAERRMRKPPGSEIHVRVEDVPTKLLVHGNEYTKSGTRSIAWPLPDSRTIFSEGSVSR